MAKNMFKKRKKTSPLISIAIVFLALITIVSLFYFIWPMIKKQDTPLLPEKVYTITGKITEINENGSFTLEAANFDQEKNVDKTTLKVMTTEKTEIQRMLIENKSINFVAINFSKLAAGQHINLYTYQSLKGEAEVVARKIEVLP